MQPLLVFVAFLQAAQLPPVRDPAFARDGRLVVSIEGDLWMRDAAGKDWRRLTSGVAWDREPAWAPDGSAVVFVSDRGGNIDLWRLPVSTAGADGEATRLTTDPAPDLEPSVAASGAVVFVRGRGSAARLWMRDASGGEHRLTRTEEQERWPAVSPDGQRVAWVQVGENSRRLLVRAIAGDRDSTVVADRAPESPTWSPDGRRLAFFSATPRAAIYVTPTDGHYVNLVSDERAVPVWSPDGATIVLGQHAPDEPGYNGDPDRVGDRIAYEDFQDSGLLQRIDAPVAPDESPAALPVSVTLDRGARNVEAFDRFWERMDRVYYSTPAAADRHAKWLAMKDAWRARARSAGDDEALQGVMHAMLRDRPVLRAEASGRAAVSSANPVATAAGLEMLRRGGNVVDAAVAVSFALAVVEPDASGPGGYGQMLVYKAGMQQPALIEFMARVPEEAGLSNTSFLRNGRYPSDGPVLAMVPGTVAGMYSAWKQYGSGRLPWADLLAPAIRAAHDGYEVSDGLATTLWRERDGFMKYPASRALFFRDGKPVTAGDTIRNPDLAWTLEHIAKGGADGFYRGEVAQRLVDDLRSHGNAVQMTDMARYFAADRTPVSGTYRGLTVYSSAPPVSGGATLVAQLNLLEQVPAPKLYTDDAATLHAMIAAWQLVPSSRGRIADPSLWPVNIEPITNKDTARARWKCFDPSHALTPASLRGDPLACESPPAPAPPGLAAAAPPDECEGQIHAVGAVCRSSGTTAFVVADADGNVVAVTQTLGTWGGGFYVSPGLGFLYNDKLTSYGTDPNAYGARLPYARHGSTLAPTIVFRGNGTARKPIIAVGAAGNAWITSAVYETLVGMVDFGLSPQRALELPRFLPGQRGGFGGRGGGGGERQFEIQVEDGMAPGVMRRLRDMGYHFNTISLIGELRMGYGAAVSIGDGKVTAGADPRRSGAAGAIPPE